MPQLQPAALPAAPPAAALDAGCARVAAQPQAADCATPLAPAAPRPPQVGDTVVFGYFEQHPPHVRQDMRLIDYIRDVADDRKARAAGLVGEAEPPEIILEKVRM